MFTSTPTIKRVVTTWEKDMVKHLKMEYKFQLCHKKRGVEKNKESKIEGQNGSNMEGHTESNMEGYKESNVEGHNMSPIEGHKGNNLK